MRYPQGIYLEAGSLLIGTIMELRQTLGQGRGEAECISLEVSSTLRMDSQTGKATPIFRLL